MEKMCQLSAAQKNLYMLSKMKFHNTDALLDACPKKLLLHLTLQCCILESSGYGTTKL